MSKKAKKQAKKVTQPAAAEESLDIPMIPVRVVVVEERAADRMAAGTAVRELGYELVECKTAEKALDFLKTESVDVLLAGWPENTELFLHARRLPERPTLVAAQSATPIDAHNQAELGRLDLFTLRPHESPRLAPALHAATMLQLGRQRERVLRASEERMRQRIDKIDVGLSSGFQPLEFFKTYLAMELKRSKRYTYPLAACLIAVDPPRDGPLPSEEWMRELRIRLTGAISAALRDIDLPVDLDDDRYLAFLPHTDADGAERVGHRIVAMVRRVGALDVGNDVGCPSVSVGISSLSPGQSVGFARIMRDAGLALRAAQLKGGGRVVVKR